MSRPSGAAPAGDVTPLSGVLQSAQSRPAAMIRLWQVLQTKLSKLTMETSALALMPTDVAMAAAPRGRATAPARRTDRSIFRSEKQQQSTNKASARFCVDRGREFRP
jgi:hypothetical protein